MAPLEGLRIVDFTWYLSGPYATMILSDLGADVVKVEAPGTGDPSRRAGPFIADVSAYFLSVNRGKRSITLNLKTEEGQQTARRLAQRADVLVENFMPGTMDRWGLGYEALAQQNEGLIYASCSGFGQTGPRAGQPAFDIIVQALAGTMSITGEPGGRPVRAGNSIGDLGAGLFLAVGILAALSARQKTGRGQRVELGMLDAQVALLENAFSRYFASGEAPRALGSRHPLIAPFQVFEAGDGYFVLAAGTEAQWSRLCQAVGRQDLAEDSRFATNADRRAHVEALDDLLTALFRGREVAHWIDVMTEAGIPCAPVQDIAQASRDSQIVERNMIVEVEDQAAGRQRVINTPLRFSHTPAGVLRSAPRLGADSNEILEEWLHA